MTTSSVAHPMPIPTPPRGFRAVERADQRPGRHRLIRPPWWRRALRALFGGETQEAR
ncbi:hypothetical protein [Pseudonocardia sp. D17]|uniref:hypothetical protein n=1 Tax=Pseudonocardia sp. D17 TaxID=882661 RepID=UPI0030CDA5E0